MKLGEYSCSLSTPLLLSHEGHHRGHEHEHELEPELSLDTEEKMRD